MAVSASGDDGSARSADCDVHVSLVEQQALGGKRVEIRRQIQRLAAVNTQRFSMKVVRREQQNVRAVCCRKGSGKAEDQ